jgi:MscS family membrane protein
MCWFHHVLGLRYETTSTQLRQVMDGIRSRLIAHTAIESESLRVRLFRFGPSSLDIEIFAYVLTGDWVRFLEIQEQLLVVVMEVVEAAGTAIALPTRTLHIGDGSARRMLPATGPLLRVSDPAASVARRSERPSAGA